MKEVLDNCAKAISLISEPKITYFFFLIYVSLVRFRSAPLTILTFLYSVVSIAILSNSVQGLAYSDDDYRFANLSFRRQRYLTYIFTLGITAIYIFVSIIIDANFEFWVFSFSLALSFLLLLSSFVFKSKLSAHISYTGLFLLYFVSGALKYVLLILFTSVIGWSRIRQKKHDLFQVSVAFIIQIVLYVIFEFIN